MKYPKLEENILDVLAEMRAKLGALSGDITLYYPEGSLARLADTDAARLPRALEEFREEEAARLGRVRVKWEEGRCALTLPSDAARLCRPNTFIAALVDAVRREGVTMDEIRALFLCRSAALSETRMNDPEFDLLLRFTDGTDPYYYCFKDEGCHITYHRFLPEDYAEMGFGVDP